MRRRSQRGTVVVALLFGVLLAGAAWALEVPIRGGDPGRGAEVAARDRVCRLAQSRDGQPLFDTDRMIPGGRPAATTTQFWLKTWPRVSGRTGARDRCLLYVNSFDVGGPGAALSRLLVVTVYVRTRRTVPTCSRSTLNRRELQTCLSRRRRLTCSAALRGAKRTACERRVARLLAPYYRRLYRGRLGGAMITPRRLTWLAPGVRYTYRVTVGLALSASNRFERVSTSAGLRWRTAQVRGRAPSPHGFTGAAGPATSSVVWHPLGAGPAPPLEGP